MNEGAAFSFQSRKCWETQFSFRGVLEQNQEVKKPAEFKLQRVEKESWQQDESRGKSGGKNLNRKEKKQESTAEEEKS